MIPVLFKEDEQIFTHNGIGALYESLSCDVIEEENGAFTMELEYPVDGELFSELKDFRIIQAKPNDIDDPHNFRIYEIEKSIDELTVFVRANTRTNDLGNNLITNYVGNDVTPQQAMDGIKRNLIDSTDLDLISDIQTKSNVEWTRINPLNALVGIRGSMVDIWGGQIKRTNNAIYLYSKRGTDKVATIRPGKNLEGFLMRVSTAGIRTKIVPTYTYRPVEIPEYEMVTSYDGTVTKQRVSHTGDTSLQEPITVVGDSVESQYINNYPMTYWSAVDYSEDEELTALIDGYIDQRMVEAENSSTPINNANFPNQLRAYVKSRLDATSKDYFTHRNPGVDKPTVSMEVNMSQLSDSPEWEEFKNLEKIQLSDTVEVWVEDYDVDVEIRVTSITYDSIGEMVTSFNAGSGASTSRSSSSERRYEDATRKVSDYIATVENGVNNIMRNTADGLNRKFEGYTEPPARLSSEGDIWFKDIGSGKTEIWIHDGVYWQPLLSEDFADMIQQELTKHKEDLDDAREVADEAFAKADGIANDILENVRDYIDLSLEEIDFGDGFNERIEEINRIAQEALNNSTTTGEIIGNDGKTLYNRNRIEGATDRYLEYGDTINIFHNGEGFADNSVYVLSMKAVEILHPELSKTSSIYANAYLDTVTEYITLGSDD